MVSEPIGEPRQGRLPPQDVEAERSVLGAMLLDSGSLNDVAASLTPEDFYRPAHGRIFEAILALYERNEPIDEVMVRAQLQSMGALEGAGGSAYLAALTDRVRSVVSEVRQAAVLLAHGLILAGTGDFVRTGGCGS